MGGNSIRSQMLIEEGSFTEEYSVPGAGPGDSPMSCIGQDSRESGIEEGLSWTPHPRSLLFSGGYVEEIVN